MTEKEDQNFVERFTVRMPDGLRDAIAERARKNGRSMNSEIVQILEDALKSNDSSGNAHMSGEVVTLSKEKLDEMINIAMNETAHAVALKASKASADATAAEIMKRFNLVPKE